LSAASTGALPFLGEVLDSVWALSRPTDLFLFADLPLLAWALARRRGGPRPGRWVAPVALAVIAGGIALSPRAKRPWDGSTHLAGELGLLGYHLVDGGRVIGTAWRSGAPTEEDLTQALEALRRRDTSLDVQVGPFEGANVVVVLLESFQGFVQGMDVDGRAVAPHLDALAAESLRFPLALHQIASGSTSDAEFATACSLHAPAQGASFLAYASKALDCLPTRLGRQGYRTAAFHANRPDFWNRDKMYPAIGLEVFHSAASFSGEVVGLGLDDGDFLPQVAARVGELQEPFFAWVLTLTSHTPFRFEGIEETFRGEGMDPFLVDYLNAVHHTDAALGAFVRELRERGILERTILVVLGDHHGVNRQTARFGAPPGDEIGWLHLERGIPLLVRLPGGVGAGERRVAAGQIDVAPTLSALLGQPWEDSAFLGENLLSEQALGWVVTPDTSVVRADGGRLGGGRWRDGACMLSDCDDLFRWGKGQLSLSRKMMEGDMLGPLLRVLREPKGPQGGRVP
jgi:phosphoglycerol transferase MdoB-like AlkP superfamily enzyme